MAILNDLVDQIGDEALRARIKGEVDRLSKQKKFGLVFEEHLPECTPLYGFPIEVGSKVAKKIGEIKKVYIVTKIDGERVSCYDKVDDVVVDFEKKELVRIAEFGEPIYPQLIHQDSVENAPDSDLWHTLIEADNYHALQLLEYLYPQKVDCIYIDPPYNTGAKDWKYNNNYVDSNDSYRHSKWLSMMEKRLKIAKKLLNPNDSVLIVTIDEKEYLHLGCLLEELFSDATIQMISSVIKPSGNRRDKEFSRCDEYIFFVFIGAARVISNGSNMLSENKDGKSKGKTIRWKGLLRAASNHGKRTDRPNLFYPILFDSKSGHFKGCGPVLKLTEDRDSYVPPDGVKAMWPIGANGTELVWNLQPETLMQKYEDHILRFSKWDGEKRTPYYLSSGLEKNFRAGKYDILGQDQDGAYILELKSTKSKDIRPFTIWNKSSHSASEQGTSLLNNIFNDRRFSFPKSLYAVYDAICFFVAKKPNALILDFFAGSATTLHATILLNSDDGGKRRCICVTNNEISEQEEKILKKKGLQPGDEEWEKYGIAKYVAWPRTICSIKGLDINGNELRGNYSTSDKLMSDGLPSNCQFLKLGFLDKDKVSLGLQFKELLSILWMKSGSFGKLPVLDDDSVPSMLILPKNRFAVLLDESHYSKFVLELDKNPNIETVFIVTDSESGYKNMISGLNLKNTYQLYRDYIDNFRINRRV